MNTWTWNSRTRSSISY